MNLDRPTPMPYMRLLALFALCFATTAYASGDATYQYKEIPVIDAGNDMLVAFDKINCDVTKVSITTSAATRAYHYASSLSPTGDLVTIANMLSHATLRTQASNLNLVDRNYRANDLSITLVGDDDAEAGWRQFDDFHRTVHTSDEVTSLFEGSGNLYLLGRTDTTYQIQQNNSMVLVDPDAGMRITIELEVTQDCHQPLTRYAAPIAP